MIAAVLCMSLCWVWHLCNLPCISVLFWLLSIARYVFKSPSICFWGTRYDVYCERVSLPCILYRDAGLGCDRMQGRNTFTVNVISCPSKANTWRFKNISCNRNEPKQYTINTWQVTEVSHSTKRLAYYSGNHADLWPLKSCHSTI